MVRMGPALARIGQPSSAMAGPATAAAPSGSFFVCPFENAAYFLSHIGSAHVKDINEFLIIQRNWARAFLPSLSRQQGAYNFQNDECRP